MAAVLTLEEVASYLRVHPSTIYRLLKGHRIPAFKVGSDWRFNRESIDRWPQRLEKRSNGAIPLCSDMRRLRPRHHRQGLSDTEPKPSESYLGSMTAVDAASANPVTMRTRLPRANIRRGESASALAAACVGESARTITSYQ